MTVTTATDPTDVLIVWVIDRSGSMSGSEQATIDGFNNYVQEQQAQPGNALLSLVLFDTSFQVPLVAKDIHSVPKMERNGDLSYQVGGGTALYDAVGTAIMGAEGWVMSTPDFTGKVLVGIWTDGEENSSHDWSLDKLMTKIRECQDRGWEFVFLGSGRAAWTEGKNFEGVLTSAQTTPVADGYMGTVTSYAAMSSTTSSLRSTGKTNSTTDAYMDMMAQGAAAFSVTALPPTSYMSDETIKKLSQTDEEEE